MATANVSIILPTFNRRKFLEPAIESVFAQTYTDWELMIADDGSIVNVEDMKPHTEDSHCAKKPVRFALEMNAGWFAAKGLRPGARLRGVEKYLPRQ